MHEWKASGVGGIPGYGTNYEKVLMLLVSSKKGGRLVIALDVGLTGYKIYEACSVGRAEKCEQVGLTESVRLAGAVAGGTAGGAYRRHCYALL